ncbi:MAG: LOG family protein [Candidatus Krumholzibacteriia bacterium]
MKEEQIEQILSQVRELFTGEKKPLPTILLREILVNSLKLKDDDLDTLDLKIINRSFRELRYAFKVFKPYRHIRKVSIFGSARTPKEDPYYKMAVDFARLLAKKNYMVITGAADGIMKAGNEGAGSDKSFGVNIHLPFEQGANEFIVDDPKLITFKYFFTRKLLFVMESHAIALFPGGFGTHDEGFETLTLLQTEKASPRPFLLAELPGETYWERWDRFVKQQLLERGLIAEEDISLYKIVHSPEEAVEVIESFYSTFHSFRQVNEKRVIRLQHELRSSAIDKLNGEFSDVVTAGKIERTGPLPEESNEPELADMPRIVFAYDHTSAGRLKQMIDEINRLGRGQ